MGYNISYGRRGRKTHIDGGRHTDSKKKKKVGTER